MYIYTGNFKALNIHIYISILIYIKPSLYDCVKKVDNTLSLNIVNRHQYFFININQSSHQ